MNSNEQSTPYKREGNYENFAKQIFNQNNNSKSNQRS